MGKVIFSLSILITVILLLGVDKTKKFIILKQIDPSALGKNVRADPKLFSDPLSSNYFSVSNVSQKTQVSIYLEFNRPTSVGGMTIFFPGNSNLETDSSYVPSDFDIYIKQVSSDWLLINQKRHFGKSSYFLNLKKNFDLEGIRIVLLNSEHENGEVRLSDLKMYTRTNVGFSEYLFWVASSNSKSFWSYLIYSFLFFLIIMIPGTGFLAPFTGEFFIFGPLVSMFVLATSSLGYIISGSSIFLYLYLPYFVAGTILFFRREIYRKIGENKFPLFLTITFILAISLLQAARDTLFNLNYIEQFLDKLDFIPMNSYFGYHADNTMPWGIARSILHQVSPFSESALRYRLGQPASSVFDRIPTLSLIVVPIMSFFGESHFIFQRFVNVLVSFYYPAVYWMIKQYFSEKVSRLTALLVLLSIPLSLSAWNAELNIKSVSMFPLVLAAGFFAKRRKTFPWLVGSLLAFSVLIHPMAVLFVPAFVLVLWLKTKSLKNAISGSIIYFLPAVAILTLWFILASIIEKHSGTFPNAAPHTNIYLYFISDSLTWTTKAANTINVFIPDYLNRIYSNFLTGEYVRVFFRNSIIGSLSPLFVFYLFFRTKIAIFVRHFPAIVMGVVPQIIFWLHPHAYDPGSFSLLFPFTTPFLLALVIQNLIRETPRTRFIYIFSYIIFMGLSLYVDSTAFQNLRGWDSAIPTYSAILWAVFFAISISILRSQEKTQ